MRTKTIQLFTLLIIATPCFARPVPWKSSTIASIALYFAGLGLSSMAETTISHKWQQAQAEIAQMHQNNPNKANTNTTTNIVSSNPNLFANLLNLYTATKEDPSTHAYKTLLKEKWNMFLTPEERQTYNLYKLISKICIILGGAGALDTAHPQQVFALVVGLIPAIGGTELLRMTFDSFNSDIIKEHIAVTFLGASVALLKTLCTL